MYVYLFPSPPPPRRIPREFSVEIYSPDWLTRTNIKTFVSPIRYLPSDTLIIGNWVGHLHLSTRSRTCVNVENKFKKTLLKENTLRLMFKQKKIIKIIAFRWDFAGTATANTGNLYYLAHLNVSQRILPMTTESLAGVY